MPMHMPIFEWAPALVIDIPDEENKGNEALDENDDIFFHQNNLAASSQDYNVISDNEDDDLVTTSDDNASNDDESIHIIDNNVIQHDIHVPNSDWVPDNDVNGVFQPSNNIIPQILDNKEAPSLDLTTSKHAVNESDDFSFNRTNF